MKKLLRSIPLLVLLALSGCIRLEPGGAYNGDVVLFDLEQLIPSSYEAVDGFLTWELKNREILKATPDITKYANVLRREFETWYYTANAARDAYVASPTTTNLGKMRASIAALRMIVTQTAYYIAKYGTNSSPKPI